MIYNNPKKKKKKCQIHLKNRQEKFSLNFQQNSASEPFPVALSELSVA